MPGERKEASPDAQIKVAKMLNGFCDYPRSVVVSQPKGKTKMTNQEKARNWVHGYVAAGTTLVVAAVLPGSSTIALSTLELTMCYHIGRIYQGEQYSWNDARIAASVIGVAAIAAKAASVAALEALNFAPVFGWVAKAPIAGAVIKGLGEATIAYYESLERN
jgi:uncharacterized protein (DUF697 family)